MTASTLCTVCRHSALVLVLIGLMLSEYLDLRALGMVLSLLGIAAGGGALVAGYLSWEHGDEI